MTPATPFRKTSQNLAPACHTPTAPGEYDIYPGFPLESGAIGVGFDSLAQRIARECTVVIDGYGGVLWEQFRSGLDVALRTRGLEARWHDVAAALRPAGEIEQLVAPFLGGDDPLWGTRFTGTLDDFFDPEKLRAIVPGNGTGNEPANHQPGLDIIYGSGAALAGWNGHLMYLDVPKNEIQFRSRAGSVGNLGGAPAAGAKEAYKRFYFVDWPALNGHKEQLLPRIDTMADEQRPAMPLWMSGEDLRSALHTMSRNVFRTRPWFEPGPWGGQWIREHIPTLAQDVPNYAWSFELIVPENGLMFASDEHRLEVSADMLMFQESEAVLGECAARFGTEFPIRFDFLDTFAGGNLSVQCHPRPEYIKQNFGESFTQDETYYILDCAPGARVYLGFREDIDPVEFRRELERSHAEGTAIDADRFVNSEPAHRGDLFLIPNGTIHCSGTDNLVLEISATPYIFTFKMYDWVRRDLDGNLRPLNIPRAYENLYFDRKGAAVAKDFISHPIIIAEENDWRIVHLPTHAEHFYDVHRIEFETSIQIPTENQCHVLNLVEGTSITVQTAHGLHWRVNHAETFVIPAAAEYYTLINNGTAPAKVVKAFVKEFRGW